MARTCGRSASAATVALLVFATACNDSQNPARPKIEAWGTPPPETGEVKGCDNGPAGFGVDTWSIDIPSRSYHKDGAVTGDIQKQ